MDGGTKRKIFVFDGRNTKNGFVVETERTGKIGIYMTDIEVIVMSQIIL